MSITGNNQVKIGAVLSYILIVCNALYGLLITPFIITHLGVGSYGVYKTITSLTSSLTVIDLGIGGTIQRYTAKYVAEKREKEIPNFIAMGLIIAVLLSLVIAAVSVGIYYTLDSAYGETFDAEQMKIAKVIFCISILTIIVHVFENIFNGIITGYNCFVFGNGIKIALLLARVISLLIFLTFSSSAIGLMLITLMVNTAFVVLEVCYVRINLKTRVKFEKWEKGLFFEAGKFTMLMFLTSLVSQICTNLDNIIIGAIKGPNFVTIYSVGLLIFSMFSQLSCGISGVMLPTVTNVLKEDNGDQKVINVVIKAGRVQFMLLGAAIVGFVFIGKDFVNVWMGEGFEDVYIITLILIVPAIFELCINVCLSILQAKNMLGFRTAALTISAIINAIITIVLVKEWSYIGAAIGTAFSYISCSLIAMNWYYGKRLKLPMLKIYGSIMSRVWICLGISGIALYFFSIYVNGSWLAIGLDVLFFCVIYSALLLLFGLSKEEKQQIPIINKLSWRGFYK